MFSVEFVMCRVLRRGTLKSGKQVEPNQIVACPRAAVEDYQAAGFVDPHPAAVDAVRRRDPTVEPIVDAAGKIADSVAPGDFRGLAPDADDPPKRKRGRPKKVKPETAADPATLGDVPAKKPTKRGRPKKVQSDDQSSLLE